MTAQSPLLQAQGVSRTDSLSGKRLLEDITLTLDAGEILALSGPSGSGKTLLLRALALLDPIQSGTILWQKNRIPPHAVPQFRSQVIYLHQRAILFEGTVEDNFRRPFTLGVHRQRNYQQSTAEQLLAQFDRRDDFLSKKSHDLSGGETQMIALLRALLLEPNVLLLDEATSALDYGMAEAARGLIGRWVREQQSRAVVWVSHDAYTTGRLATRHLQIDAGRIRLGA